MFAHAAGRQLYGWAPWTPDQSGSRVEYVGRGYCPGPCDHRGCRASRARVVFRWWQAKTDPQFFTPSPQPADFGPGCGEAIVDGGVAGSGSPAASRSSHAGLSAVLPRPGPVSRLSTSDLHF